MKKVLCYVAVIVVVAIGLGSIGLTAYASSLDYTAKQSVSFTQAYTDLQTKNAEALTQY